MGDEVKIAINACYGGFRLSYAAYERLIELGIPVREYIEQKRGPDGLWLPEPRNDGEVIFDRRLGEPSEIDKMFLRRDREEGFYWDGWTSLSENRAHPLVVQVIEELGDTAGSSHSRLRIVEIPDSVEWEIDEYDGLEHVAEKHRTWYAND